MQKRKRVQRGGQELFTGTQLDHCRLSTCSLMTRSTPDLLLLPAESTVVPDAHRVAAGGNSFCSERQDLAIYTAPVARRRASPQAIPYLRHGLRSRRGRLRPSDDEEAQDDRKPETEGQAKGCTPGKASRRSSCIKEKNDILVWLCGQMSR